MWSRRLLGAALLSTACADTEAGVSDEDAAPFTPDGDWRPLPLRFADDPIPAQHTSYLCRGFSVDTPALAQLVAFEPHLDGAALLPHHMVLYRLAAAPPREPWECLDMPAGATAYFGWAPGTEAVALPAEAGFLIGDDGPQAHFALQIHYENPGATRGLRDSSGMVAWASDELRPQQAGVLTLGTAASLEIPPGQEAFEYTNQCLTDHLPDTLEVFGTFLHGHTLLRRIWTDQFRDAQPIDTLGRDDHFRFDLQRYTPLEGQIVPGDRLITHCVYDSRGREGVTVGGEAASDEMCLNSLFYYPRVADAWCGG